MRLPCVAAPTRHHVWTGRPGGLRRPHPAAASEPAWPPPGYPGHDPALASPSRAPEVDLPKPARAAAHRRGPRRARGADGAGEPELGLPPDPGRTAQTRPSRRRLDHPPDPAPPSDTPGPDADRHQLAAVPAYPGRHDVGRRLLPRRLRGDAAAAQRSVRTRGPPPLPARPGRDRASGRAVDDEAARTSSWCSPPPPSPCSACTSCTS
jgi:hypothetical protein